MISGRTVAASLAAIAIFLPNATSAEPSAGTGSTHPAVGVSVSGAFFQYLPGNGHAPPLVGAKVFIRPIAADANWIGPSVTDTYGRFLITDVPPGDYLLRSYVGKSQLWEQQASVDRALVLSPIVVAVHDSSINVTYYPKTADGSRVTERLRALGYRFITSHAVNQAPTNAIWFGAAVSLADVKLLGASLIEVGIPIRAIRLFREPSGEKAKRVEIGSDPDRATDVVWTIDRVQAANSFPH